MITIQKYVKAKSLDEAYELNQNKKNRIIAGMLWTKMSRESINTAIDLSDLQLNKIEETEDEFSIGAMVTLRDLECNEALNKYSHNAIKDAVKDIVGVQFRNSATIGGSIWGRFGFSDVLTVFLSMDSYVELYKGGIVSLEEFSLMEKDRDILIRVIVKKRKGMFTYLAMRNQRTDFPTITCAVSSIEGKIRTVIGARPGKAVVVEDSENILKGFNEENINAFCLLVADKAKTQSNMRASKEYRTHLIKVLTKRALEKLGGNSNGN